MDKISKDQRIERLSAFLPKLSEGQILWIERIISQFSKPRTFSRNSTSEVIKSDEILDDFGDALRIHHCFTDEPFTKDKFEYVLVNVCSFYGLRSEKSTNNTPGADISIDDLRYSLKTQADKNLKPGFVHIHKYMELGRGEWTDNIEQLKGLTGQFLRHLSNYDKVLVLRNTLKPESNRPIWKYELVEIPIDLLKEVSVGEYEMMNDSIQNPKPGYCRVYETEPKKLKFELYFDGGTERKLKINKLDKDYCKVHAEWEFYVRELDQST